MDLEEVDCEDVHWIQLAEGMVHWHTLVNAVMNLQVP
jgi:hypothetical protein